MAFEFKGFVVEKVGIVGSGQIGPDIALHFSKVLHPYGVPIVVVDIAEEALARGRAKLDKKVGKGVEHGAFKPAMGDAMKENVTFTSDYEALKGATLIVEAATEDCGLKGRIFQQVAGLCPDAVFASNSSHLEPERIFEPLSDRSRTLVVHYFFPAERNPMVEIVPGAETDAGLIEQLMGFYEAIGKAPIRVGSQYGYAVDPIFEGLFQAAAYCVEEGLGTTKEVDAAAARALGLTVGNFTAMNLTGGNPITCHGLDRSHDRIHPWYRTPQLLKDAVASGERWDVPARGEKVVLPADQEQRIADAMRGAYLGLVCNILDSGITNVADMEMAIEVALDMTPPFRMMNEMGVDAAMGLVDAYAKTHPDFPVAESLKAQAATGQPWTIDHILRQDVDGVAVLKIRRPRVLNALNADVFGQLQSHFERIAADDSVKGAVLTGFGVKAFVSGADVSFIAGMDTPEAGRDSGIASHGVCNVIENVGKPVVAAMNGLAFGGGLEIAMACTARLLKSGMKVAVGQPEVNLGIIPGAGGTQRLPRLIGLEAAAQMLRTGRPISGAKAVELGLVRAEVPYAELVPAALALVQQMASGEVPTTPIDPAPTTDVPDTLPDVKLGHLSTAVDAILCKAILDGCRLPLKEGQLLEANLFADVCRLKDMRIGIDNFLTKGPRSPAPFVHE